MKKKFKLKIYHRTIAVAVIVAAILVNLIVGVLSEKLPLEFDLTANKVFSLSDETVNILKNLNEDVDIYYLVTNGNEDRFIQQTLDMYKGHTNKLRFSQIDPAQNPMFVNNIGAENITENSVIVKCGDRVRIVDVNHDAIIDKTLQQQNIISYELEIKLTSAIDYVLKDTDINVVFTKGHEEIGKDLYYSTLYSENATISEVDLKTQDMPENCNALYIIGPKRDFSADELSKIAAYVNGGGSVNISLDYGNDLPTLNEFMKEYYGISFDNNIVMETEAIHIIGNNPFYIVPNPSEHDLTAKMLESEIEMVWPYPRSIQLIDRPGVTNQVLFKSSDSAVAQDASNISENIEDGEKGTYAFATIATVENDNGTIGKVLATGTSLYADPSVLNEASLANLDFVLGAYSYLHRKSVDKLSILPKNIAVDYLNLTLSDIIFYIVVVGVLPFALIIAAGVFVWFKRRRL